MCSILRNPTARDIPIGNTILNGLKSKHNIIHTTSEAIEIFYVANFFVRSLDFWMLNMRHWNYVTRSRKISTSVTSLKASTGSMAIYQLFLQKISCQITIRGECNPKGYCPFESRLDATSFSLLQYSNGNRKH